MVHGWLTVRAHVRAQDKRDIERNLQREARTCQRLILWLDCDREGENIAFEVLQVCRSVNPGLRVSRAHFSALIPRDLFRATETLTDPNEHWAKAVDARQEIDLRIGAAFTRFQTMRLRRRFHLPDLVSYGPCQFPTLGFVVERFLQRERFRSEPFWRIELSHRVADGASLRTAVAHARRLIVRRGRSHCPVFMAALWRTRVRPRGVPVDLRPHSGGPDGHGPLGGAEPHLQVVRTTLCVAVGAVRAMRGCVGDPCRWPPFNCRSWRQASSA